MIKKLNASPFDYEGNVNHNVDWIKDGILKDLPVQRYWAKHVGIECQEHL